eukprot:TRINITY_DN188_c1_g1_i1.p1 TRINITY_DN188_c1_g1~~TRINITY_DN188_c1_g1_i1.p1  ORF type:complete len:204 (+),score=33.76 TRINITY_DN188_c1_g1_i1:40-612(+)
MAIIESERAPCLEVPEAVVKGCIDWRDCVQGEDIPEEMSLLSSSSSPSLSGEGEDDISDVPDSPAASLNVQGEVCFNIHSLPGGAVPLTYARKLLNIPSEGTSNEVAALNSFLTKWCYFIHEEKCENVGGQVECKMYFDNDMVGSSGLCPNVKSARTKMARIVIRRLNREVEFLRHYEFVNIIWKPLEDG